MSTRSTDIDEGSIGNGSSGADVGVADASPRQDLEKGSSKSQINKGKDSTLGLQHNDGEEQDATGCCNADSLCHRLSAAIFVLTTMAAMGATGLYTILYLLQQGILSEYDLIGYDIVLPRSNNVESLTAAFVESTGLEQQAYVLTLWFHNMFVACAGMWVYSILRGLDAPPRWSKVMAYGTCIPILIASQWSISTMDLMLYLEFEETGVITQNMPMRFAVQIVSLCAMGLCTVCVVGSIAKQLHSDCCANKKKSA